MPAASLRRAFAFLLLATLTACAAENGSGSAGGSARPDAGTTSDPTDTTDGDTPASCAEPATGCPCGEPGTRAPCYPGPDGTEGVGVCRAGEMVCIAQTVEFPVWGACDGAVTPSVDTPGDGVDQDCRDGDSTEACTPDAGGEVCDDERDNDCDGLVDCDDEADCPCDRECTPSFLGEICFDRADNDCDGLADCDDDDCDCDGCSAEPWGELCWDGRDNDCDGLVDCDDEADCPCTDECTPEPEVCDDGVDNDCNGLADCDDADKCPCTPECVSEPEVCDDGMDNDCDGQVDCDDSACDCTEPAPERLYAHTGFVLYAVTPGSWTVERVGSFGTGAQVTDLAIDNDGHMYCVSRGVLYTVDPTTGRASRVGDTGVDSANALTFLADGRLALAGGDGFHLVDPSTGSATRVGSLGGDLTSSGDLSGSPAGPLYLTASGDDLVRIDPSTGRGTSIGPIGTYGVYGLAYWSGALYGFTNRGDIREINLSTGRSTVVRSTSHNFTGAAVNQRLWD